jgi:hypothetical protein
MTAALNILFFAKRSRTTVCGTIPIYLRVSIGGKRMEVTMTRFVLPNQWSKKSGKVKGPSQEVLEI